MTARECLVVATTAVVVLLAPIRADAQDQNRPHHVAHRRTHDRLSFTFGVGYLGSTGLSGGAFALGVRYLPIRNLALGFDAGYGVEGKNPEVQDRWWLMPSVALALPLGPVELDAGVGLGFGATSGYTNWSSYVAAPFGPTWAFQLVPTARVHVMASTPVCNGVSLFVRFEAATLLLGGNEIGSRVGNSDPGIADTIWYDLLVGLQFRIL